MHGLCTFFKLLFVLQTLWTANASSFLSETLIRKDQVQSVLEHHPVNISECENPKPTGPIDTTMCDYETVESVNGDLFSNVHELVQLPFFKYFQIDLYRECPLGWADQSKCANPSCAITTIDESQVPLKWRASALSKVDGLVDERHELPGCYYRDSDFCWLDDNTEGDYYDLTLVPERFTGYSGPEAHRIWRTIYEENCFGLSEFTLMSGKAPAAVTLPDTMTDVLREDGADTDQCLEKRVYYKVISGLHASISTHICAEYLNQTTGEWSPNLQCFVNRIASHPERLQYIYFNTVLLLRAVARLGPYLTAYDYCSTGTVQDDVETKEKLLNVISIAQKAGKFDESVLFRGENANILKEEFKAHFRNVTRIMDCVGCDKCRLWGKIQTTGIATALKVLFELDEKALDPHTNANLLQRSEVVALVNTLHRFSESLEAVNQFRQLWADMSSTESEQLILEAEKAAIPIPRRSPTSRGESSNNLFDEARMRVVSFIQICKESTLGCMARIMRMCLQGLHGVSSIFHPSGKENGPGAYDEL
ncbi:hypothetical protein BDP27DRAFT_1257115 [Rhodocollybia butyracea]|uniref:Endoplasmic oxidoreductin n=1 Tax=Rhodocollybia butyracea TaxID=206335 RepID=A0A9P5UCR6_9AGAR|nr:hypothetical protein BDP27DRAFT_1257115 [Rhodocollybia butyracea]